MLLFVREKNSISSHYRYQRTCDAIAPGVPSQEVGHWNGIILHTAYVSVDPARGVVFKNPDALRAPNGPSCHNRIRPRCVHPKYICQCIYIYYIYICIYSKNSRAQVTGRGSRLRIFVVVAPPVACERGTRHRLRHVIGESETYEITFHAFILA